MEYRPIIQIQSLVKDYGQGRGVFNVSFEVYQGECFGFLGPNGAGKSTTIRHLMGFSKPQSGCCLINGAEVRKKPLVLKDVSYLPGEIALPRSLTGKEVIEITKKEKGVIDNTFLDFLIQTFQFDPSIVCKDMSLGSKRKLAIICCFMSDPDIIILDEPSSGLDPEMQKVFISLIKAEKKRNKTMLMSSHIFSEIDSCCDRIAVIKDGEIVSLFNADDLKHKTLKTYIVSFSDVSSFNTFVARSDVSFKTIDKNQNALSITIAVDDKNINLFMKDVSNLNVSDFREIKETLEDYFMSFYKEEKTFGGM